MSMSASMLRKNVDRMFCRLFGHQFINGPRFHSTSERGFCRTCARCRFYETVLDQPPAPGRALAKG